MKKKENSSILQYIFINIKNIHKVNTNKGIMRYIKQNLRSIDEKKSIFQTISE